MIRYWYWLKYSLLGISLSLFIILSHGKVGNIEVPKSGVFAQTINPQENQHNQARILTEKGYEQLKQGQAAEALQTWQEAARIYRQLHNQEGVTGSLSNQSLALQELSLNPRACTTLLEALDLEDWVCQNQNQMNQVLEEPEKLLARKIQEKPDLKVRVLALRNLGNVLRLIGKPDSSEIVLKQALAMAKRLTPASDTNDILLSLANTERTLYSRTRDRYQTTEEPIAKKTVKKLAQDKLSTALNLYHQVADSPGEKQNNTALQARLNSLSLSLELERLKASEAGWTVPEIKALQSKTQAQIQPLVEKLLTAQFSQLPAIESVYARLNFANSLIQIGQSAELSQLLLQGKKKPLFVALKFAQEAMQVAHRLGNKRAESYALGTIGNLYTQNGQQSVSKQYLEAALGLAQSVQAWDITYQWQQKLGRLYQQEGNLELATKTFEAAVNSLDQVRGSILSVNPDIQFSFKEKVEPIYREYIKLLLAVPNPNLEQVIQVNEQLQLAELENFLQCGKLDLISLSEIQKTVTAPTAIYLIKLDKQVEVIVRSSEQSLYRHTLNIDLIKDSIDVLLESSQDQRFNEIKVSEFLLHSQAIYSQLLAPIKKYLPESGTLVFVLDNYFQGLPLAMLHDGKSYLIKNYNISTTLGSQLRQPQVLKPEQLRALIVGISKQSPSLNSFDNLTPLPEVEAEVADIKRNITSTVELLNDKFTTERFQEKIDTATFPLVHITTHGQFSSDPERTILLAWDRAINVRQLNSLLRSKGNRNSIELLVLSACQTAKGDKRSALGIAGVAAQAGARSTLATLWLVEAESTAQLMGEFYKNLRMGFSKAEALRQAQLSLWSHPKYQHPYYWSGFVLVGSWL